MAGGPGIAFDMLVTNAGGPPTGDFRDWDRDAWIKAVDANMLTPIELIKLARPDVLIKGADYSEDQVVGAAEVRAWGGEVRLAQIVDGYSTTAALNRMQEKS